jgi:hypothetical protein
MIRAIRRLLSGATLVCTSIATAHRITQFRVVELFEAEKRTVTHLAKPAHRQLSSAARKRHVVSLARSNSQGSSHTHKTDDIEARTAVFSGAVYNALLPTDPAFPTGMAMCN